MTCRIIQMFIEQKVEIDSFGVRVPAAVHNMWMDTGDTS
jgi:hypothetical protein